MLKFDKELILDSPFGFGFVAILFLAERLSAQEIILELVSLEWAGAMVREEVEVIGVDEKSVRSQEDFVDWDGCRSQAARKRVKKLITSTSLMSVVWVGAVFGLLIRIAVVVVVCVIFLFH